MTQIAQIIPFLASQRHWDIQFPNRSHRLARSFFFYFNFIFQRFFFFSNRPPFQDLFFNFFLFGVSIFFFFFLLPENCPTIFFFLHNVLIHFGIIRFVHSKSFCSLFSHSLPSAFLVTTLSLSVSTVSLLCSLAFYITTAFFFASYFRFMCLSFSPAFRLTSMSFSQASSTVFCGPTASLFVSLITCLCLSLF